MVIFHSFLYVYQRVSIITIWNSLVIAQWYSWIIINHNKWMVFSTYGLLLIIIDNIIVHTTIICYIHGNILYTWTIAQWYSWVKRSHSRDAALGPETGSPWGLKALLPSYVYFNSYLPGILWNIGLCTRYFLGAIWTAICHHTVFLWNQTRLLLFLNTVIRKRSKHHSLAMRNNAPDCDR